MDPPLYIFYIAKHLILKTFEELGVSEEIRRAIEELGFEHPMPVQEEVIPYLLGNGNDVIALAQTGTPTLQIYANLSVTLHLKFRIYIFRIKLYISLQTGFCQS